MKLLNFTIIKLTLCLVIGILIAHFFHVPILLPLYICLIGIVLLFVLKLIAKTQFKRTIWFGLTAFTVMVSLGCLVYNFHFQKHQKLHYSNWFEVENNSNHNIIFKISERLKSGNYYDKYIIEILKIDSLKVKGKSLLNVQKDSTRLPFKVGNVLITHSELKDLIHPLNPNQFDYKNYLEKKYIYHQVFTENKYLLQLSSEKQSIYSFADAIREYINKKLKSYPFKPDELAVINALLLGQRQDLSPETYNSYVNAGAVHILAVSGLHVGIILLLLNFLLKPLEFIKHGVIIKLILIVSLLWSFAIIAGLSASVTRAVTMFSIIAIAMHLKRPTNIFNTLAISIFVLLLFKPMFLFDVGFQLSYLAVIAIVTFQPILYKLWKPKYKVFDFFWQIFTVTIAAQFGIIPISLYYFHQFPSLFFISNLAIIPFLGVILGLGIMVIILAVLNILPLFLAQVYGFLIELMNTTVGWVSKQEQFLFKDISFEILQVITSYILIVCIYKTYKNRSFKNVIALLCSVLLLQGSFIYYKYKYGNDELVVFHKSRYSLLSIKNNSKLKVYDSFDSISKANSKIITNYNIGNFISEVEQGTLKNIYSFNNKMLLVIDSLGTYNVKSFKPDYVLLTQSPKLNINRLIDSLKPKLIIADGSNYKSYIERWEATCAKRKLPFHQTSKKGAFILKKED